jgi:hypothetical protein
MNLLIRSVPVQDVCSFCSAQFSLGTNLFRRATALAACVILPAMFAAGGPPPVTVNEPVAVTGVVEVINDVLRQPYRQSVGGSSTSPGFAPFPSDFIKFDVPEGKRLIVETISVQVRVNPNQSVLVRVETPRSLGGPNGLDATVFLPVEKQASFPTGDYFVATQPMTLRVDGTAATNELSFGVSRNAESGSIEFRATVFGYLVDIPVPAP